MSSAKGRFTSPDFVHSSRKEHRDHTSDGRNQYLYDAEGRICAVHDKTSGVAQPNTEYIYNADGTRVAKGYLSSWPGIGSACPAPASGNFTLTRQYLLDSGADQVTELNGSGAWQHSNAFQGGRLTATYDTAGLHYAIADPLGTKRVQFSLTASGSAQLDEKCKSLPFGNDLGNPRQASCSGTVADATEHHFTGKERDTESGNDYFGARYYASSMGRFLSPDWSARVEPVPYAKLDNPQSLNLYVYVGNNPLIRVDADGHFWNSWCSMFGWCGQPKRTTATTTPNSDKQSDVHLLYSNGVIENRHPRKNAGHPWRDNNPGDLRYSKNNSWQGQAGNDGGMAVFDTAANGSRALDKMLHGKGYSDLSVDKAIERFAPPNENDTEKYKNNVHEAGADGSSKLATLNDTQMGVLEGAIKQVEGFNVPGTVTYSKPLIVPFSSAIQEIHDETSY